MYMASAEREPIAVPPPPVGSRGKAPDQRARGRSPPEADAILISDAETRLKLKR